MDATHGSLRGKIKILNDEIVQLAPNKYHGFYAIILINFIKIEAVREEIRVFSILKIDEIS